MIHSFRDFKIIVSLMLSKSSVSCNSCTLMWQINYILICSTSVLNISYQDSPPFPSRWSSDTNIHEKSEVRPPLSEYPAARKRTPRERVFIVAVIRGGAPTTKRAASTLSMFSAISLTIPKERVKVNPWKTVSTKNICGFDQVILFLLLLFL